MDDRVVYRILDAAANRAAEGLRTAEEFARFGLGDALLSRQAKELRHGLTTTLGQLDRQRLLAARDTPADCGTEITTSEETRRQEVEQVLAAALARVQQSLRCLEEYGKLISAQLAAALEQLRYRSYSLEKDLLLAISRRARIADSRLYVLVDLAGEEEDWLRRIVQLADDGVDVIQLRDKNASDRLLLQRAALAADALCREPHEQRCQLIINDRADIAAAVGADGVHVGQDELTVAAVRRVIGADKIVGVSTHSMEQALQAVDEGADYIGCGPTFPSQTKQFEAFPGVDFLQRVAAEITVPAFAIGGIDADNLAQVIEVGCLRIAVGRAVWQADDVAGVCQLLKGQLVS